MSCFLFDGHTKHTCAEVKALHFKWKKDFRERNATDAIIKMGGKDRMYEQYCEQIDAFLDQCKCEPLIGLKCDKCPEEEHEGFKNYFCRCESRNIKLARLLRNGGFGPENVTRGVALNGE